LFLVEAQYNAAERATKHAPATYLPLLAFVEGLIIPQDLSKQSVLTFSWNGALV